MAGHRRAAHPDLAVPRLDESQHAADERALAHAVASHEADGLAAIDAEIDAVKHMAGSVIRVQLARLE